MTEASSGGTLPDETHIGRTALRVSELDALTDFYRTIVGLVVLEQDEATSVLGADNRPLLVLEGDVEAPERHRSATGLYHNAFRVPSRAALGDALLRVREDWHLGGASDHRVSEALYLTDPEGNGIEIHRDFPREEWPIRDDGVVAMGTDPLDLAALEADAAGATGVPPDTDVGHVHLEVSSLDAFEDFYVDTLGFEQQVRIPAAWFVSAGGYHHHIGANTWHHRTIPANGRGLSWFEVVVPTGDALDELSDRFGSHEIAVTTTDDGIVVSDPDEIEIRMRVEG